MRVYSSVFLVIILIVLCESHSRNQALESEENTEMFRKYMKKSVRLGPIFLDTQKYFKVFVNICRSQIQIYVIDTKIYKGAI